MKDDMTIIRDFWTNTIPLYETPVFDEAVSMSKISTLKKDEYLIRNNEPIIEYNFLLEGIAKVFPYENPDDEASYDMFIMHRKGIIPITSTTGEGKEGIARGDTVTLTDCVFLNVPSQQWFRLIYKYPEVYRIFVETLNSLNEMTWEKMNLKLENDAKVMVDWFYGKYPDVAAKLRKKDIALFLGIAPETLSRLLKERD